MMKLFKVGNTSSEWWVIAPDKETAIDYSYQHTSTREKKNLCVSEPDNYYCNCRDETNLKELLSSGQIGIVVFDFFKRVQIYAHLGQFCLK